MSTPTDRRELERIENMQHARRTAETLLATVRGEEDEPWNVREEVYDRDLFRTERFMVAGNGPTAYACFAFDSDGEMRDAYISYFDGSTTVHHVMGTWEGRELYEAMKDYRG